MREQLSDVSPVRLIASIILRDIENHENIDPNRGLPPD